MYGLSIDEPEHLDDYEMTEEASEPQTISYMLVKATELGLKLYFMGNFSTGHVYLGTSG